MDIISPQYRAGHCLAELRHWYRTKNRHKAAFFCNPPNGTPLLPVPSIFFIRDYFSLAKELHSQNNCVVNKTCDVDTSLAAAAHLLRQLQLQLQPAIY